jgi:hypothetical protein
MAKINLITPQDIEAAASMPDLDAACLSLQEIAEIEDGGVAAMCFSDINFEWETATKDDRMAKIANWLETEKRYAE